MLIGVRNGWHWWVLHHGRRHSAAYFPAAIGISVSSPGIRKCLRWLRNYEAHAGYVQAYDICLQQPEIRS